MSEIQPFIFPTTGQPVRTLLVDGEPWFVAADVAAVLDLGNAYTSLALLDGDKRALHSVETPGGDQNMITINEPGLYSFVLRSRKPEAKAFKRWITHDVLPAIRKTGSYSLPREYSRLELIDMARESELARIEAENRAAYAECQMLELAPAARAWDEMAEAAGDYAVREAAQILSRDPGIITGQKRLFAYLRTIAWIDKHNVPYQRQIDLGRIAIRARTYEHPKLGDDVATQQVRITIKGLGELHKLLGGQSDLPALVSEQVLAA